MRILVATDSWFPDIRGGSARVAAETARRLAARGHDVTVLAPVTWEASAVEVDDGLTVLRCLPRNALPQTVSDTVSAWRRARRLDGPFDVFVGHQSTVAAGLAAGRGDAPLILVYHASGVREALLRAGTRPPGPGRAAGWALAAGLRRLERVAVHRAERVLVLSAYSRSLVTRDHPEVAARVFVVPGGVDTQTFSPGRDEARAALGISGNEALLVSVRRLEPRLGLETLLRAFERVTRAARARLVVVGDGSLAPRLRALAEELGLAERLQFAGVPTEEALQQWYRAADLFVLPPAPHEGFGMATIEALASGTPAVAAPVGASPELLAPLDRRLLARSAEPADLASAIIGALRLAGPELRRRCRDYASSRFAWDRVILDWESVLVDATRPIA